MSSSRALKPAARWPLALALIVSLVLHGAFGFVASEVVRAPHLGIEFQLPIDVEFGMSDAVALTPSAPPAPPPPEQPPIAATPDDPSADKPKPKPKPKPAPDAAQAPTPLPPGAETRMPAGAQIAVRVDMARIRRSPLADDIRGLLAAIPDWQALLDGSGIDPVEQLDRFMIATPNLQRSKIIVAGRFVGDEQTARDAVARLAAARGVDAPWRTVAGVPVAPWANQDATPRVIALVGPHHFVISREEDLPRILAVASARSARTSERTKATAAKEPPRELPADALLSMDEGEGLSVEVEGAEQFVRRAARGIPQRLRLSALELPGLRLGLRARLSFTDPEKAGVAAPFWGTLRDTYASNTLVALLGLAEPLRAGTVDQDKNDVLLSVNLEVQQARLIVGYLRELVRPPAAAPTPSLPGAGAKTGAQVPAP